MNALFPTVHAVMTRRLLINFRVRPEALADVLPSPFRPKLVNGWAMGGICLIRLENLRPPWVPRGLGTRSENAAHRIAVEWTEAGRIRDGVFIPRRDTNSLLNRAAGGRLFPGLHHAATFRCAEMNSRYEIELRSQDGQTRVSVAARLSQGWPSGSVFRSLDEASAFFRSGNCGWSPVNGSGLEGVELCTKSWAMQSLAVERVESSFFNDRRRFPSGTVEFDCALLMRGIAHEWRALGKFPEPPIPAPRDHRRTTSFFELP